MAKAQAENVTEAGTTKRTKTPKAPKAEGAEGEKGAPRPRKWNYGIAPENKVAIVPLAKDAEEPKLKAGEAEGYALAKKGCTVEQFIAASDRGILRRLSRKGLVNVIGTDGTKYPIEYVAPEKPAKKEQEAGEKAA